MDFWVTAGAIAGNFILLVVGAIEKGEFKPIYLIDALSGAIVGAASAVVWAVPADKPESMRFLVGLVCGLGGKTIARQAVKKMSGEPK